MFSPGEGLEDLHLLSPTQQTSHLVWLPSRRDRPAVGFGGVVHPFGPLLTCQGWCPGRGRSQRWAVTVPGWSGSRGPGLGARVALEGAWPGSGSDLTEWSGWQLWIDTAAEMGVESSI